MARNGSLHSLVFMLLSLIARVAPSDHKKNGLCFPVLGDFGGVPYAPYTTTTQKRIANHMAQAAARGSCQFVVTVGDNFYYTGVRSEDDPRFYLTFEKVYIAPSLFVPWYIIAGNHDHITNITAQVAYSKKSPRWHFPSLYYSQVFKIPGSSREMHLIMIDTTLLCQGGKHKQIVASQDQLEWLKNELSKSRSDYIVVSGHHPVLSAGVHGNTECLVRKVKPLLEKYAVSAYFSGHDHNLQHIHEPLSKVHYFVSGSGNFFNGWVFNKHRLPRGSLKFFYGHSGGFAMVEVSGDNLALTFINELDKVIYRTLVQPRYDPYSRIQKFGELLRSLLKKPLGGLTKLFSAYGRSKPVNKKTVFGFS